MKKNHAIATMCWAFLFAMVGVGFAQAHRPSIQTESDAFPLRNIIVLYYDDAFLFAGRHYGDGRDFAGATEPALLVHSKATNRWLKIKAISTENGRFGKSSADMMVSVSWDFTALAGRPYIDQPLKATGSIMFPDKIEYDLAGRRYALRHASASSAQFPGAETVLYVGRADLVEAFGRQ
jgi:hypothetical protein